MSQALIIECMLIRKGGTQVDMGDKTIYHFKDDGTGAHVATISNPEHIGILLGIREAYRVYGAAAAEAAVGIAPAATAMIQPAPIAAIAAPAIVAPVIAPAPAIVPAPAPSIDPPTTLNAQLGLDANMDIDQLRAVFLQEVGREPSARAKPETMIAQIEAVRAERAGK